MKIELSVSSKTIEELIIKDMVRRLELAGIGEKSSSRLPHMSVSQISPAPCALSDVVQPIDEPSSVSSDVPSDVVQSFEGQQRSLSRRGGRIGGRGRKQGSGRFCCICGGPNDIRPDCPHSRDCYRCLMPGHVARYCTASEPVRKVVVETRYDFEGQISNLTTAQHGLILVKATVCRQ